MTRRIHPHIQSMSVGALLAAPLPRFLVTAYGFPVAVRLLGGRSFSSDIQRQFFLGASAPEVRPLASDAYQRP